MKNVKFWLIVEKNLQGIHTTFREIIQNSTWTRAQGQTPGSGIVNKKKINWLNSLIIQYIVALYFILH